MKYKLEDGEATVKVIAKTKPAVEDIINSLKKDHEVLRLLAFLDNEFGGFHKFMIIKVAEEDYQ